MGTVRRDSAGVVRLETVMLELAGLSSRVGWFESARYDDGTSVAYVATIQEFGDPSHNIPPRPFMRTTIVERQAVWADQMKRDSRALAQGKLTPWQVFERLGLRAEGDVRTTIANLTDPPLSPLTIAVRAYLKAEGTPLGKIKGASELKKIAAELKAGTLDLSGVSTKPLVFSSLMLNTLTSVVEHT